MVQPMSYTGNFWTGGVGFCVCVCVCASTTFYKAVTRYLFPTIVRYIPLSVAGTVADYSPHKGWFGEAAIQHCLKYVAFAPSDDARVTVCEKVQARWNSERKAGLIYFARIPFRADFNLFALF